MQIFQRAGAPSAAVFRQPRIFAGPLVSPHRWPAVCRATAGDKRANVAEAATVTRIAVRRGFGELGWFSMRCAKMSGQTPCETLNFELAQSAHECALPPCIAADPPPVFGSNADRNPEPP